MASGSGGNELNRNKKSESREERLKKVQSLVDSIQRDQKGAGITKKMEMRSASKKIKLGRGQRREYKIKIGWENYRRDKYRLVTKAKGGETREIPFSIGEDLTVKMIKDKAIDFFFPDGKNIHGRVEEFEFMLVSTSGDELNNMDSTIHEYLKARGIFASQCHLYLRSKKIEQWNFSVNCKPVNKVDNQIHIKYSKLKRSLYSSDTSEVLCNTWTGCKNISGSPETEYDVFEDGYSVVGISVNNSVYLERDENNGINCLQPSSCETSILNGPDEIFGFETDDTEHLMIGAISLVHNSNCLYRWERNGELYRQGLNYCVIKVRDSGKYRVTVQNTDSSILGISDPVKIDVVLADNEKMCVPPLRNEKSTTVTGKSPEESTQVVTIGQSTIVPGESTQGMEVGQSTVVTGESAQGMDAGQSTVVSGETAPVLAVGESTVVTGESTQGMEVEQSTVVTGESAQGMDVGQSTVVSGETAPVLAVGQSTVVTGESTQGMEVGQSTVVTGESTQGMAVGQSIVVREESTQGMEIGQFTVVTRESTKGMGGEQPSLQLVKPGPSIKGESSGSTSVKSTLDKLDIVVEGVVEIRPSQLRYIEEINKGAFGIVYKAVWNETTVAVKKIPVKRMKKSKHLLERELKVNSSIRHPSIVLFLGYHVGNNEVQLVTEYMNGPNLEQVLFEESELDFPLDKRISTGYQICSAVSYLHSRIPVILHRDIKPENVVLSKCLSVAKLCDMGLSKFKSFTTVITTMAGGTQPGTAAYKAPEVFLYNSSASLASDVWSLSATLVELLTDEVIWENSKNTDSSLEEYIFTSMKHEEQPDGLKCLENKDIPIQIKEVVSTGLEYRVSARPAAVKICQQFREMLRD